MKKLFTMLVVSLCGTMAYAQTGAISVGDVTIAKGGSTQMEVTVNNAASNTAFQFDLKLPAGVSVKSATMNSGAVTSNAEDTQSRKLLHKLYTESDNVYRFLSYDNANAALTDGKVNITLEAADDAEIAEVEIEGSDILVVNPEGTSTTQADADVASITVAEGIQIPIPAGGKTTFVCDKDLDFNGLADVKAYIATGYDLAEGDIYLTRVMDVPAKTPFWVKGPKGETVTIPEGTSITYYPQNFLVGNATGTNDIPADTDEYSNWTLGKDGSIAPRPDGITGFPAGKAYLHLPKKVTSSVGSEAQTVALTAKGNKRAYVTPCDLDFEKVEGLKAFAVTAFSKDGTIWLTRVMKASANTPLYLKGEKDSYSVPTAEVKMALVNMLKGDATNATALKVVDGDFTTCVLSKGDGVFNPLGSDVASFPAGTSYLPLPTSYIKPASSRGASGTVIFSDLEAEVEVVKIIGLGGNGEATGISRIATEVDNDVWYNLNGQRIDTPTRKGLYIKNGKKVIVK